MMRKYVSMPCASVHMGIYLCRGDAFMTQHFLHHTQVGSPFHQMGGERMSEGMRGYLLADIRQKSLSLDHLEHRLAAQRFSEPVKKQDVI